MNPSKIRLLFMVLAIVALLGSATAFAQRSGARLEGTVRDAQGLVIPGVLVVATNQGTNVAQESYTNDAGNYVFPLLQPGKYTVSAELSGFKKASVTDFQLEIATTKTLNLTLTIGELSETVTVKADAIQQVQTSTSDLGDVVYERKIKDLPLNGRLPIELIFLQPGMAGSNKQSSTGGLSASGSRAVNNSMAMDGVDITNSELGTGSSSGIQIATDIMPSVDTIEEFRLITGNPSAEYGRASGFQVEIATKSGTNAYHGNLYEFYRGTVLNANKFFNNASKVKRPPLLRNQFGGSIGGPVKLPWLYNGENRTFFFVNYEGMRQSQAQDVTRTVITPEARQGIYRFITPGVTKDPITGATLTQNSRNVVDETGAIRPGVQGIQSIDLIAADKQNGDGIGADTTGLVKATIDKTPLPNDYVLTGDGLNYAGFAWNAPAIDTQDNITVKLDHTLNQNHNLSFRASWGRLDRWGDFINASYQPFPDGQQRIRTEDQGGFAFNLISRLKPTMTNEFRVGLSRNKRGFSVTLDQVGVLAISTTSNATITTNPYRLDELQITPRQTLTVVDNVSWIMGQHSWKAGFSFRSSPLNQIFGSNSIGVGFSSAQTGVGGAQVDWPTLFGNPGGSNPIPSANRTYAGDLYNFLMGRIGTVDADFNAISEDAFGPLGTGRIRGFRERDWGLFLQDDWKVNKNLTLNLGVRWDYYQVPWEVNSFYTLAINRLLIDPQMDPTIPSVPVQFGRVGPKYGNQIFADDYNNFAPVVGFSWDPWGNNKTAIRGSYRISYDRVYSRTLDTIEQRTPGMSQSGQYNAGQLQAMYGMTRYPRLADLTPSLTNSGAIVGSGSINLYDTLDLTKTSKPLQVIPNTRQSYSPSDFEKTLTAPYSQSWSFGIQREIMRNTIVEVRYVGRKGVREFGGLAANQFRAPADVLKAIQDLQGLMKLTNAQAYALAGKTYTGSSPNALVTISTYYGTAPANATNISQYTPGPLANIAPQALYDFFLAGNSTFASDQSTNIRNVNLSSFLAQLDTSTNWRSNAFLVSAGFTPPAAGVDPRGYFPTMVFLPDNAFRPSPQFLNGPVVASNAFYSGYHGLQTQFNRRFYNGLQLQANYTWSKNMDITATTQPTGNSVTDFWQRNLDKAPSVNDCTHDFKASSLYELPFGPGRRFANASTPVVSQIVGGWQLSAIFEMATSYPYNISYSSQTSSFNAGSRPDFMPDLKVTENTLGKGGEFRDSVGKVMWMNAADFTPYFKQPIMGTVGNVPRNFMRGPGYWNLDLGILKNFTIAEGKEIQFRGEFFNIVNNANFGDPNSTLNSSSFGQITSTRGDPRIMQFALKFYF